MKWKWWWPYAAGAAVGAGVAAWGIIALSGGANDGGPGAQGSPSPSSGAVPALTASPPAVVEPSPPVDGAIPVPAFPASAIPWSEIGPGWFLLSYDPDTTDDTEVLIGTYESEYEEGTWDYKVPNADEALTLVSPTGDIYYVTSLAGQGPVLAGVWRGGSLDLYQPTSDADGIFSSLDLASGAASETGRGKARYPYAISAAGSVLSQVWDYESLDHVAVLGVDGSTVREVCTEAGAVSALAPDGRRLVCLEPRADNRADVVLYDVDTGARNDLDVFKQDAYSYGMAGWWDAKSLVVSRWDEAGPLYWAYDVEAKKLRELNPLLPDGSKPDYFMGLGSYHQLRGDGLDYIYGTDDSLRASLPCELAALGGDVALTLCEVEGDPDTVTISVTDLVTGATRTVVTYPSPLSEGLVVYSYPGTPDVAWSSYSFFD